jgi:negative regulator of flagellin synthesis FlgM
MVDSLGAKPIMDSGATRITAATPTQPATGVAAAASTGTGTATARSALVQAAGLASSMAASAPIDTDRVATIKKAIAEGRFPILPATVADRLIALKLQWSPNGAQHDAG